MGRSSLSGPRRAGKGRAAQTEYLREGIRPRSVRNVVEKCRCADCGFLAVWMSRDRPFEEADAILRQKGQVPYIEHDAGALASIRFSASLVCFVMAADLLAETKS